MINLTNALAVQIEEIRVELRVFLKAQIRGAFLVVWGSSFNRVLLKEERNCNTAEYLSVYICCIISTSDDKKSGHRQFIIS